jgi:hypothetical protein
MIMGARATKTLTYLFWQRVFGVKFVPHPLQAKLPAQHVNGHRLTIRYFWPERATRAMLKLRAAQGGSMQAAMCAAVADFFGDAPFIWSLPQSGEDGGVKSGFWTKSRAFAPRLRIPGRSYGLNYLREHHNVALLSVINLPPQMYQLLEKLGITSDEVTLCLAFAILYQDLLRSSLRDPTAVAPVICVVPDLPSALALQDELPGSRIEQTPEHLIPVLAEKKKPGSKPDPNDKRTKREKDRDRQRRKREKDREQAA